MVVEVQGRQRCSGLLLRDGTIRLSSVYNSFRLDSAASDLWFHIHSQPPRLKVMWNLQQLVELGNCHRVELNRIES